MNTTLRTVFLFAILTVLCQCAPTEKIGNYRYKVKTERAFTGDNEIVVHIKSYQLAGEHKIGCVMKSYKLGRETKKDTLFSEGFITVEGKIFKCLERTYFPEKSEVIKVFEQNADGSFALKK